MVTFSAARVGMLSTVLALTLAGCSSPSEPGDDGGGAWSYTTSFGNTIALDAPPEALVVDAYSAAALWDYGIRPTGVFGFGLSNGLGLGTADPDTMTVVGTDAQFSTESAASLGADLVIGYSADTDPTSWIWWEEAQARQVDAVAPFLGIDPSTTLDQTLDQYRSLAEALGGNTDGPQIEEQRAAYEKAKVRVRDAVAAKPDLTVLPINASSEGVYLGTSELTVLGLLDDLGVDLAGPATDGPWATVSWENIAQYPADIVLEYPASREILDESPVYASLPGVAAKQILDWDDKRPNTYAEYADWLNRFAETIDGSSKVT